MKFKDLIQPFLKYKKDYIKRSTFENIESHLKGEVLDFFGEMTEVTQQNMDDFVMEQAKKGWHKSTINGRILVIRYIVNYGSTIGKFPGRRFVVNMPSDVKEAKEIKPLTVNEVKVLSDYFKSNFSFLNLIIYTCVYTGLRAGELSGLKWGDIDLERKVVKVERQAIRVKKNTEERKRKQKHGQPRLEITTLKTGGSLRDVPLAKQLLRVYKRLIPLMNENYYVLTNSIYPAEQSMIRKGFKKIIEDTGLPEIRLHDLRHTFATRAIEGGVDFKTVSALLGHSTVETTLQIYTHVDESMKSKAIEKLSKKMR